MSGAPGKGQGAQFKPGESSQTMDWQAKPTQEYGPDAVQTETPAGTVTAPEQPKIPVKELQSTQQNIGGPGGTQTTSTGVLPDARAKQAKFLATPQDVDISSSVKKLTKARLLDSMLLKALGVKYATKEYSKTN
jgi:hypothetical protein